MSNVRFAQSQAMDEYYSELHEEEARLESCVHNIMEEMGCTYEEAEDEYAFRLQEKTFERHGV